MTYKLSAWKSSMFTILEEVMEEVDVMNDNHIQQIFSHYIQNFEMIDDKEHCECYKWQIAKIFRMNMDDALAASLDEFAEKLYEIKMLTENLIDSYM